MAVKMDMLSGSMLDKILLFAIPIAASSILQQLFTSVDVAVVGHFASDPAAATAAVGCNGPVINLIINLFVGISIGANVVIAGYIGGQDEERASRAVHSAMAISAISGILLLFICLGAAEPLLILMNTPESVLSYAVEYLRIYSIGLPFIMIYNFGAAILRSIGDTKRPLLCLIATGILNAALNLFLVIVFHLDVAGVAIATVASNAVSAVLVVIFLMKEKSVAHLDIRKLSIAKDDLRRMLCIGIPAGLQNMVFSLSNVILQSVMNGFGTAVVAGSAVSLNYENFAYFIIVAFNQTAVTFTSQNYSAGKYDRCRRAFRECMLLSIILTACMSYSFLLGRYGFAAVFTDDQEVMRYAVIRMMSILPLNFLSSTYEVGGAALRGMGYSMIPALITIFGTCLFRLIWAYTVCPAFPEFEVLLMVYPISWVITGGGMLIAYFIISRRAFFVPHYRLHD